MNRILRYLFQILAFSSFAFTVAYFSAAPPFDYASQQSAVVKLSLSHATDRVKPCVLLTPEQIAKLAPNMRRAEACERERIPLTIELDVDGKRVLSMQAIPSGLWNDGPASIYQRFELPAGNYQMNVRLRDTARTAGWDYTLTEDVNLVAGRYLTITFKPETGGFKIR